MPLLRHSAKSPPPPTERDRVPAEAPPKRRHGQPPNPTLNMNRSQADKAILPGGRVLSCVVTPADVEAMLDAYDSGMCDLSTANCLSRALARELGTSVPPPLHRHAPGVAYWTIEGERVAVPPEMLPWLDSAEIGLETGPRSFTVQLATIPDPNATEALVPMVATLSR